ncbi:putative C-mannosyltransferase DPY19L1 isoform 3 [Schistosoma japonicum]|nr:putative C-mannosyltransferase DPY19L1 isoform 3 [Schistosoma japonicum]
MYHDARTSKCAHPAVYKNVLVRKPKTKKSREKFVWLNGTLHTTVFLIAVLAGVLHWYHVSSLHENDLFFSHLSNMERELTFRTEMGFYYSYFKQIILAPSFMEGFNSLLADTRTEYPPCLNVVNNTDVHKDIKCAKLNAIERFNVYPELLLAGIYRFLQSFGLIKRYCFQVKRDLPTNIIAMAIDPVVMKHSSQLKKLDAAPSNHLKINSNSIISCVGSGEPPYFYVNSVFILSGLILFGLTYSGWFIAKIGSLNESKMDFVLQLIGAFLPTLAYFSNHREATRVQWTPPLRESFAYPFFVLQQSFLLGFFGSNQLFASHRVKRLIYLLIYCILLLGFQLPWQFSQFALLTQIVSITCSFCLSLASNPPSSTQQKAVILNLLFIVREFIWIHLIVFSLSFLLQYGNRLLLQSGYLFLSLGSLFSVYMLQQMLNTYNPIINKPLEVPTIRSRTLNIPFIRFLCLPLMITCLCTTGLSFLFSIFLKYTFSNYEVSGSDNNNNDDGGHIWDLLKAKLSLFSNTTYKTFHTMLYICAPEFDFISWAALKQPMETGLLYGSMFACFIVSFKLIKDLFRYRHHYLLSTHVRTQPLSSDISSSYGYSCKILQNFVSLLVIIQMLIFTIMAVFIMRLKLFWTPQMCISLGILAQSTRWFEIFQALKSIASCLFYKASLNNNVCESEKKLKLQSSFYYYVICTTILVLFIAFMSGRGLENLKSEWSIQGSFSAYENEVLIGWFRSLPQKNEYPTSWIISGPMSLLGNLRLTLPASSPYPSTQIASTNDESGFAFTNHPHYENTILRYRTILAYGIYSRKPVHDVWHIYRHTLKTDFVIVETHTCPPRGGCSKPELFDLLDPHLIGRPALCESLMTTQILQAGQTPSILKPYFTVVYVEPYTGRFVLYVNKLT